jgi:hypothetical protein
MRRDAIWLLASMCLVGAFAWWMTRSNSAVERSLARLMTAVEQSGPAEPHSGTCVASVDPRLLRAEIERAVEQVVAQRPSLGQAKTAAPPPPEPDPGPTPEQIKAFDAATGVLNQALTRRTWTAQDVQQIRPLMIDMDPDNRQEIMRRVVRSVNEGKLQVTGRIGELF